MTHEVEPFDRQEMEGNNTSAYSVEIIKRRGNNMPWQLPEQLGAVANRIRRGLHDMNASYLKIGHELRTAKKQLTRTQFLSWLGSAGGQSPRMHGR